MLINVYYDEVVVSQYLADLLVDERVRVELKAAESIASKHEAQILNYLKATEIEVGLAPNFGTKPQFKRKIFETARER